MPTQYVVGPMRGDSKRWHVKANGRMVSKHNKKRNAIETAKDKAGPRDDIVVQRKDGTFQERMAGQA